MQIRRKGAMVVWKLEEETLGEALDSLMTVLVALLAGQPGSVRAAVRADLERRLAALEEGGVPDGPPVWPRGGTPAR